MTDRRRVPRIPRRSRPAPSRRRAAAGLAAAVALVATAGFIGSRSDSRSNVSAGTTMTASDGGGVVRASGSVEQSGAPDGSLTKADSTTSAEDSYAPTGVEVAPEADESSGRDGSGSTAGSGTALQPKIIRTGSVELVVKRGSFADAVSDLTSVAAGVGGFVSASETTQLGDDPRGTVTLRVPAKDFDRVLARVGQLGDVAGATTGSQDVTGEYTDVAARIKALQDEREQIRLVLAKADTIPDILSVRDRLSAVQGELEQLQGRQQVLDDQTSLSTLTVSLEEKGSSTSPITTKPAPERTGLAKVWHDAADRFGDGARSIALGFASMGPWLVLALVLWLPARILWRRMAGALEPATAVDREPAEVPVG